MLEFEWQDAVYTVDVNIGGLKNEDPDIKLPAGVVLKVDKWFPTKPPRPISYKAIEPRGCITYSAVLIRKIEKKELPLSAVDIKKKIKKERLKIGIEVEFQDFLAFCGKKAFDQYISDVILGFGAVGEIKEGYLVDIKYELKGVKDQKFLLDIDADTSGLGV